LPEETHKRENFSLQISYRQEYVEEEHPKGDLVYPVQSPESFIKVRASTRSRVLCFLAITSIVCLGALVIAPVPIVQGAAAAIWLGSLKVAQHMLSNVNKQVE
jgi:hypothetical protein